MKWMQVANWTLIWYRHSIRTELLRVVTLNAVLLFLKWQQLNSVISMENKSYPIHSYPKACYRIHSAASAVRKPGACKRLVTDVSFLLPVLFYTWH